MGVGCRQLRDPVLQDPDSWPQGRPVNSIMAQLCEPQDVWDLVGITGESHEAFIPTVTESRVSRTAELQLRGTSSKT